MNSGGTVVALAGRRIDAKDSDASRFPLSAVDVVKSRLLGLLREQAAVAVVASAACGADLLGLEAALELGLRIRVVLPYPIDVFRASSVTDRPGNWGARYDAVIEAARRDGALVRMDLDPEASDDAYATATRRILEESTRLVDDDTSRVVAVAVWEGSPRAGNDLTSRFLDEARRRGITTRSVSTSGIPDE